MNGNRGAAIGSSSMKPMEGEIKTVGLMIGMYCRGRHGGGKALCESCRGLFTYAEKRILKCPFGEDKPVCSQCRIHCYKPHMREEIGKVMRFSGPRMTYRHPILAFRHAVSRRKSPDPSLGK